jgi:hypothetical protein
MAMADRELTVDKVAKRDLRRGRAPSPHEADATLAIHRHSPTIATSIPLRRSPSPRSRDPALDDARSRSNARRNMDLPSTTPPLSLSAAQKYALGFKGYCSAQDK